LPFALLLVFFLRLYGTFLPMKTIFNNLSEKEAAEFIKR